MARSVDVYWTSAAKAALVCADVIISTDPEAACKDVDIAVMVGGFPRKGGMERKDVMAKNVAIYKSQAAALQSGAKQDVKVKAHVFACLCTIHPGGFIHIQHQSVLLMAGIAQEGCMPLSHLWLFAPFFSAQSCCGCK